MRGQKASVLVVVVAVLAAAGVFASSAGAVLVHVGHRQVAGIAPVRGVSPASIPGSFARRSAPRRDLADSGTLDYHGGVVLHGSSPYLIFWDPNNEISAADKLLYERYLADSAADSGKATNVFAVAQQFTDTTGFAQYRQVYASDHSITDTQPYPATSDQCTENRGFTETACLFDGQIQTEVKRVISANGLPTGVTGDAPIYFVVTPPDVNSCFDDNSTCADDFFCAYHSNFNDDGSQVLYSDIPTVLALNDPKSCQSDNNAKVQQPNGQPIADVVLKALSHEYNETITDPVDGGGWYAGGGLENGDICNGIDQNADSFLPTLGGSADAGTLFDQLVKGNQYYTQTEWSNGDVNCKAQPTASEIAAAFAAPSTATRGLPVPFDPSVSTSAGGYTSTSWSFGDFATSFAPSSPVAISHSFSAPGSYPVSLTLVDRYGNLSNVSHAVSVHNPLSAAFKVTTPRPASNSPVAFDGSGSAEAGGTLSYGWSFGDGSAGSGVAPAHTYAQPGTYPVTLTVSDQVGATAATAKAVKVVRALAARIKLNTAHPVAGLPTSLSGVRSTHIGFSIASYKWAFGDKKRGSGASVRHRYGHPGRYQVTLRITDASGATSTAKRKLTVRSASITGVQIVTGKRVEKLRLKISGPGTLRLGKKKVKIKRATTFLYRLNLSAGQRTRLRSHHSVGIRLKFRFSPKVGKASSKAVRFELKS